MFSSFLFLRVVVLFVFVFFVFVFVFVSVVVVFFLLLLLSLLSLLFKNIISPSHVLHYFVIPPNTPPFFVR